jgi:TRAP-type C4-dicarboxylate transport system permease small subunit
VLSRLVRLLAAINARIVRAGLVCGAALVAAMTLLAVAQIISRGLFSYSLDWSEEFARFALVWSVLLVAPFAYRRGAHIAIGSFAEALPLRLLLIVSLVLNLLVLWLCARFFIESIGFWRRGLSLIATSVAMPLAWVYAIVPLVFAVLMLVALEFVLQLAQSVRAGEPVPGLAMIGTVAATDRE